MTAVTITQPLLAYDGRWLERIENGSFGGHGAAAAVPFVLLVGASVVLAARACPRPAFERRDVVLAVATSAAWLAMFVTAPAVPDGRWSAAAKVLAAAALVAAVAAGSQLLVRRRAKPLPTSAAAAP
jgi:hypothetical protein